MFATSLLYLRNHTVKIDPRGLRKVGLAAMFITITLVYIGQLAMWGIFIPITPENAQFTSTPLSTIAAASAGIFYLWRVGIPYAIEITVVAIMTAHFIQRPMMPFVYSIDIIRGEYWFVFAYIMFAISLFITYALSYSFFTGWQTSYKNKLIIATVFVVATSIIPSILGGES